MSDKPIWERREDENNLWWRRFERFRRMGARRSVLALYREDLRERGKDATSESVPQAWAEAARQYEWVKRAEAWDEHQAEIEEAEWQARRRELREQEWEMRGKLIDKVQQMLVFPLAATTRTEKDTNGNPIATITIIPARWSMRDAAIMSKTASELGRLAADLATDHIELDWRRVAEEAGLDPDFVFNELVKKAKAKLESGKDPQTGSRADGSSSGGGGQAPISSGTTGEGDISE